MLRISELKNLLASRPFWLMDGAIGTELERRGYQTQLPFWTAFAAQDVPDLLKQIYQDYLDIGCNILTANTFRISWYLFKTHGKISAFQPLLEETCIIARNLIPTDSSVLLAASVTTLEDCYRPDLTPNRKELQYYHAMQLESFSSCPVDFILAETINNLSEACVLLQLAHEMRLPIILSIITNGQGAFLSGEPIKSLMKTIDRFPAIALSINCRSPKDVLNDAKILSESYDGIKGAYANAPGHPKVMVGWDPAPDANPTFSSFGSEMFGMGYSILGGCCGSTPDMIRALKANIPSNT